MLDLRSHIEAGEREGGPKKREKKEREEKTERTGENTPNKYLATALVMILSCHIAYVYVLQTDMINEATLMAKLDHRHIVCMVGICQAENIMLVLELAALGPLNKYLKKHRSSLQ